MSEDMTKLHAMVGLFWVGSLPGPARSIRAARKSRITEHQARKHVATALQLEKAAASFAGASDFAVLCKWHENKRSDRDRK